MSLPKHHLGFADDSDTDANGFPFIDMVSLAAAALEAIGDSVSPVVMPAVMAVNAIVPAAPGGLSEPQLDGYTYGRTSVYGSNITEAWRYSSGAGVTVALMDDGFAPLATATFGNFSSTLSEAVGGGLNGLAEPTGSVHGTTTAGLIDATGAGKSPEGLAPNATIVGVKVTFSTATVAILAQAEEYAASVSSVVNNSWGYTGYGVGEPDNPGFAAWYSAIEWAVADGRRGLGDVITFAAGNDRQDDNNLAVQPITADYRVIAVAATDADGLVASYSTPGAALLTSAIGDNVAVVNTTAWAAPPKAAPPIPRPPSRPSPR